MIDYFSADRIRAAEHATGTLLSSGVLMRRASHGVADVVAAELRHRTGGAYGRTVGLLIGSGDNGGDALFAGAFLRRRGVRVRAQLLNPERAHAAGLAAFTEAGGRVVAELGPVDLVVDGIVGLSGRGPLREPAATMVAALDAPIVAVDLPSGVDADTGFVHPNAVRAAATVTFGVLRNAHALAAVQCGRITLVDIGIEATEPTLRRLTDGEIATRWPVPRPDDDKYTQGVVGVVAGSDRYPGAAILCTGAAVAATSGMVRYVGSARAQVVSAHPEVVSADDLDSVGRVQAWVIGPGAGTDQAARERLHRVLADDVPVLVDADALTLVAAEPELVRDRPAPTLLTPHAGEFARLTGSAPDDRVAATRDLAQAWGATVLLKGRATVIADPDGMVLIDDAEASWAATAGSGDVLSGMAGSLLAAGLPVAEAAAMATRVHSLAAIEASEGAPIGASSLLGAVHRALVTLRTGY
ncbi:NAD(P)H-hydrate dehydratase [Jongsikchunia kroppenstedtii]|uniref:NAD(P)H-hydrate dehydratase n=1 Tax=Jongsikchunia kroppenstedtii TaxID=1121721 RepID=UPI00037A76AD|nr:NAD(P)H-hydrate dehydratase [Jongsikchunia kroppenstedtii]